MISRDDKQDNSGESKKLLNLPRITPPQTPSQSITSRRTNCFGPALVVDIQSFPQANTGTAELNIVVETKSSSKLPNPLPTTPKPKI